MGAQGRARGRNSQAVVSAFGFGRLGGVAPSRYARTAGGGHCNLYKAAAVSILGVSIVAGGWLDRFGGRAGGGRQGRRAWVLACRGRRDRGQEGTKRGTKKPETSKEHPRNMLATSLQL
jgi:hypothetical protein